MQLLAPSAHRRFRALSRLRLRAPRRLRLRTIGLVWALAAVLAPAALAGVEPPAAPAEPPPRVVACDLACYGKHASIAWSHLGEIGVTQVVMPVPQPADVPRLKGLLAQHHVAVAGLRGGIDLAAPDAAARLAGQLAACKELGAKLLLLSATRAPENEEAVVSLFRGAGDEARRRGVTIALVNRPPLAATTGQLDQLLRRIDHPNVRANFDTGAVYEHEQAAGAVEALPEIVDKLACVTITDHRGDVGSGEYPAVGKGEVDVAGVLGALKENGYTGPLVVLLDPGALVPTDEEPGEEAVKKAVADSVGLVMTLEASIGRLRTADYIMVIGYFVLMLLIGFYFYRFMRGMKQYFTGGNDIPWWLSGVSFYMTSFSVFAFVVYSSLAFQHGWVGVTLFWVTVPATIVSVTFFAKRWRRARIESPVEYLETRYSGGFRQLVAWQGIPVKMVDDALKLVATGTFISVGMGIPMTQSMLGAGLIMLAYTFMGGLWAVAVTDFIQFVVLAVAVLVVLPLSISEAGGLGHLIDSSPPGFFSLVGEKFDWWYVGPLVILYCLAYSGTNWALVQRYYCVKSERDVWKVGWLVVALNVVGPPLMFLPAMAARQFLGHVPDAGNVYPLLCLKLLPAGVFGLVIAAMFSATMSTLSGDYNVCASVLTNDVYRRLARPGASQRELVLVGRVMTIVIGLLALGVALLMSTIGGEGMFRTMVTLFGLATAPVAIPMLAGLVWRRASNAGALAGFLGGLMVGLALYFTAAEKQALFGVLWDKEILLLLGTSISTLVCMIVTSLLSPAGREEKARAEVFHDKLEVPIGQLPEDQDVAPKGFSPFRVVGLSVACIGAMLLAILPWVDWGLGFGLSAGVGLALVAIGGLMAAKSRELAPPSGTP